MKFTENGGADLWGEGELLARKRVKIRRDLPTIQSLSSRSLAMEQYRKLALRIEQRLKVPERESLVLSITSPDERAGKTLTSLNLALTLANRNAGGVLLVDGDLWRPRLQTYLSVVPASGFREVLQGKLSVTDAIVAVEGTGLQLITAGGEGQPEESMFGSRLLSVITEMRSLCPVVIFDSSPLPLIAVSQALTNHADGTVLVVGAGSSRKKDIEESLSLMDSEKLIGMVLNRVHRSKMKRYYYDFKD